MELSTDDNMPITYNFQQNNDPKHTSKLANDWLVENKINLMKWAS